MFKWVDEALHLLLPVAAGAGLVFGIVFVKHSIDETNVVSKTRLGKHMRSQRDIRTREYYPDYIRKADEDDLRSYGLGQPISDDALAAWDIDIRFDGAGLPAGSGSVSRGEGIYDTQCASCHGDFAQGEGRYPVLAGGEETLTHQGGSTRPEKTIGSYWAYAPTLFDYVRRTMPYTAPQSLSDDETYAVVAYLLFLNNLVDEAFVADAKTLRDFKMPNRDSFDLDPRPDVKNKRCMKNCLSAEDIQLLESIKGVTPLEHLQASETAAVDATAVDIASVTAVTESTAATTGNKVAQQYMQYCNVCHAAGVGGAPLPAAAEDWQQRLTAAGGSEGLLESVLNGKGAMPPKGGAPTLSKSEIKALVDYMLAESQQ